MSASQVEIALRVLAAAVRHLATQGWYEKMPLKILFQVPLLNVLSEKTGSASVALLSLTK